MKSIGERKCWKKKKELKVTLDLIKVELKNKKLEERKKERCWWEKTLDEKKQYNIKCCTSKIFRIKEIKER